MYHTVHQDIFDGTKGAPAAFRKDRFKEPQEVQALLHFLYSNLSVGPGEFPRDKRELSPRVLR